MDLIFFLSYAAATLGQFADTRTTEVGLTSGFVEANSLMAKVIKKIGISPVYAIKCAVLPGLGALTVGLGHETAGTILEVGIAAFGFALGVVNFLKLKKNKITFSQVFLP